MHGYGTRASLKPRGRRVEESRLVELVLDSLHGVAPTWSRASSGRNEGVGRGCFLVSYMPLAPAPALRAFLWLPDVVPTR